MFALASNDISNADVFKSSKLANSTDYFYGQIASVHHRASGCSTMDSVEFPKIKTAERIAKEKRNNEGMDGESEDRFAIYFNAQF